MPPAGLDFSQALVLTLAPVLLLSVEAWFSALLW